MRAPPCFICDTTGSVGERNAYSVCGAPVFMTGAGVVQSASTIGFETLYAGYRLDGASPQMYYVRNRFLLPQVGTWNKRDPLGYVDGANLSTYSPHPIVVTDPSGFYREPPWLVWLKNGGPGEKVATDPSPASSEPLWLSQLKKGGPGKNCAACHPPQRFVRRLHWTVGAVYEPLVTRLREICSLCWEDPMIPQCADINKCLKDAERIAKAIAATMRENWSILSFEPMEGGYYCYAWAHAFFKSFEFSNSGDCFSAQIYAGFVPLSAGQREGDVKVHVWLWITSPCGESVFVDDGYKDGQFVHEIAPRPPGYTATEPQPCEVIERKHPYAFFPQPFDECGASIAED